MAKKSGGGTGKQTQTAHADGGVPARKLAAEVLQRIEKDGAYANLVLPEALKRCDLADRDRRFVTELVYGTTRMRRACDFLVDRYLLGEADPVVRAALRLGAYQLHFLRTPAHAALDATVGAVGKRRRSIVNAVLRKVAAEDSVTFPDRAVELSYPDWIVEQMDADLGVEASQEALVAMNRAATVSVRDDGYTQDPASQQVVELVNAVEGDIVVDLCAAPGGKATGIAATGARVVAVDLRANRTRLIKRNVNRLSAAVGADGEHSPVNLDSSGVIGVITADGVSPPIRPGSVDKVLIDAPCSGLGSLRRRADARWRIDSAAPDRLATLQLNLVLAGLNLLRPGGVLTYSVCTLTAAEGVGVLDRLKASGAAIEVTTPGPIGWERSVDGVIRLLPGESDGMTLWQVVAV